jgi:septum formation protein
VDHGKKQMRGSRNKPKWILASASPRRSELLKGLGLQFLTDPSGIDEPPRNTHESPSKYAVRLARLKAREVAQRHKSGRVLSADTIVVLNSRILGKPASRAEARLMIQQLSGRWHEVITGICLIDSAQQQQHSTYGRTRVHFRHLSTAEINWYLNTLEYKDKAGAYGVQGYASLFIDRIEGCYFNIVGFPISAFERLCQKTGINLRAELNFEIPE